MRSLVMTTASALLVALAAGCSSSRDDDLPPLPPPPPITVEPQQQGVETGKETAPTTGTTLPAGLETAGPAQSRAQARTIENEAIAERNTALSDLEKARARSRHAAAARSDAERYLAKAQKDREGHAAAVERLDQARADLVAHGVAEPELRRSIDPQRSLEHARLEGVEADVAVYQEELAAASLEAKDADLWEQACQARVETAEQRGRVAAALYARAERRVRAAELEKRESERLTNPDRRDIGRGP